MRDNKGAAIKPSHDHPAERIASRRDAWWAVGDIRHPVPLLKEWSGGPSRCLPYMIDPGSLPVSSVKEFDPAVVTSSHGDARLRPGRQGLGYKQYYKIENENDRPSHKNSVSALEWTAPRRGAKLSRRLGDVIRLVSEYEIVASTTVDSGDAISFVSGRAETYLQASEECHLSVAKRS